MIKNKNTYNANQFISKTNHDQSIKKNDTKLTYDEIRKIVEHTDEKRNSSESFKATNKKQV